MITLGDKVQAANIAATVQRLVAYDAVWTASAQAGRAEDLEPNRIIVDQMSLDLSALGDQGAFLRYIAAELGDQGFERALRESGLEDDVLNAFRALAEREGGFAALANSRFDRLDAVAAGERESLASELERLRSNRPSDGDMSEGAQCVLGIVAVAAGVILEAWPVAAAGVLLAAAHC